MRSNRQVEPGSNAGGSHGTPRSCTSGQTGGAKRQVCAWTGPDRDLNAQVQVLPEEELVKVWFSKSNITSMLTQVLGLYE